MADRKVSIPDFISRKRDGGEHTREEIQAFIDALCNGTVLPAQTGAWLMAVYLNGMSKREAINLTDAMMRSGHVMSWPEEWRGEVVDKHSTGGVGDKVSLVLAPALAACGLKVPMISGRRLEHTGGTLDKLESMPGFRVDLSPERLREVVESVGCCITGQTPNLTPADKHLYAVRDATTTVNNDELITGSIISKKAAEGLSSLVLDVKTGNGAFKEKLEDAEELAKLMVDVGCSLKIRTAALITSMECPLGHAVGNALEVAESVHCLQGKGPQDLMDLVFRTGGLLLHLAGKADSRDAGYQLLKGSVDDRSALAKFKAMIVGQGVDETQAAALCDVSGDVWSVLTPAAHKTDLTCPQPGVIQAIRAMPCGRAAQLLEAGTGGTIDRAVGLYFLVSLGDKVTKGTPWVTVHHSAPELPAAVRSLVEEALVIVPELKSPIASSRVLKVIEPTL